MTNLLPYVRRKVALAILIALTCGIVAHAQAYRTVYVHHNDGKKVGVAIAGNLIISSNDDQTLIFTYNYQAPVFSIDCTKLAGLEMSKDASGIEPVADYTLMPVIESGELRLTGIIRPIKVLICNASGIVVYNAEIAGDTTINLGGSGAGVYVINIDGVTYKMYVK